MQKTIKILYLAAEADPFIKIGGLADVAGSLPIYLRNLHQGNEYEVKLDIRLALPFHRAIKVDARKMIPLSPVCVLRKGEEKVVQIQRLLHKNLPVYFFQADLISEADSVYAQDQSLDRDKYALFCLACVEFIRNGQWKPDIIHANDWHTALALHAIRSKSHDEVREIHRILTVHNLPYMGGEGSDVLESYQLQPSTEEGLPSWGRTQPLPMGLASAESIIPVSPRYGKEILTPEFGCGLDEYLQSRSKDIHGILNGLDESSFDPATDGYLPNKFTLDTIVNRVDNKRALQERMGLPQTDNSILFGMVGRINFQKGVDIALRCISSLQYPEWQFILLGSGDVVLENQAKVLQEKFPDRVRVIFGYDESLGRMIYGGADLFLMPSRYEPCGLAQMIAMRYGCVPIVRATGGLKDTVDEGKTGFLFENESPEAMAEAIGRAVGIFGNIPQWQEIQARCMSQNFGWANSAKKYRELYIGLMMDRNTETISSS